MSVGVGQAWVEERRSRIVVLLGQSLVREAQPALYAWAVGGVVLCG